MKNTTIILVLALFLIVIGSYFGYNFYQKTQEDSIKRELEVLKNTPESEKCIVSISGDKYDVTSFRLKHPGGNVFKCGEDMTESFNKQHGEKQLQQIQKYKVIN